jgi:Putative metallopeptidase
MQGPIPRSPWRRLTSGTLAALGVACVCALVACSDRAPDDQPLPPASDYKSTPEHDARLEEFTRNVLDFVLLHEMGHMMVSQYGVRLYSRPEDAADSFAAAVMLLNDKAGYRSVLDAAKFWDARFRSRASNQFDWTDEHSLDEQRTTQLVCLVYVSDRTRFGKLLGLSEKQATSCDKMAANVSNAWAELIGSHLDPQAGQVGDPNAPNVAVYYTAPPDVTRRAFEPNMEMTLALMRLPEAERAKLRFGEARAREQGALDRIATVFLQLKTPTASITVGAPAGSRDNFTISGMSPEQQRQVWNMIEHGLNAPPDPTPPPVVAPHIEHPSPGGFHRESYNYLVIGDNCYDGKSEPAINAAWSPEDRSITLCYALVSHIDEIGRSLMVEEQRSER